MNMKHYSDHVVARNKMEVLIIFDIAFFYFTIISLIIFNAVVRCRRFHTIRERMIGSIERFKHLRGDSLYIVREDVFWFTIPMTRIMLMIMIDMNRTIVTVEAKPIRFCILAMNLLNMVIVYQVFFAHSKNNFVMDAGYRKWKVPIFFVIYAFLFALECVFLIQMSGKSYFWGPLTSLDISLQMLMFLQVIY